MRYLWLLCALSFKDACDDLMHFNLPGQSLIAYETVGVWLEGKLIGSVTERLAQWSTAGSLLQHPCFLFKSVLTQCFGDPLRKRLWNIGGFNLCFPLGIIALILIFWIIKNDFKLNFQVCHLWLFGLFPPLWQFSDLMFLEQEK